MVHNAATVDAQIKHRAEFYLNQIVSAFSPSNFPFTNRPMLSPVNASPRPSRAPAHRLGVDVVRYSFIVGDWRPLILAGLPAH